MEASEIQDLMQELISTAVDLSEHQMTTLHRCCTIIEEITSDSCKELIRMSGERACLQVFMSDGWSTDIRTRASESSHGVSVQRTGRLRTEFIIQRTIVKAVVNQEMKMAMKLLSRGQLYRVQSQLYRVQSKRWKEGVLIWQEV